MTWQETHERTRIIREVEAAAADMSGALPWREEWTPYFGSPAGLLRVLRARWKRTCEAQLDVRAGEDALHDTYAQLRRSNAGVLAILRGAGEATAGGGAKVLALSGASLVPTPHRSRWFRSGPTLP